MHEIHVEEPALDALLRTLLEDDFPAVTTDDEARRRGSVATHVFAVLTRDGTDEGALAPFFLLQDGAYEALVSYVYFEDWSPHASEPRLLRFAATPSLETFVSRCMVANAPAIFPADLSEPLFAAASCWVTADGLPCVDKLAAFFPDDTRVTVADCSEPDQPRRSMCLRTFAASFSQESSLYLRDLHLVAASRSDFAYVAPKLFAMDWQSWCYDYGLDASDLRFVYCGPGGTRTPTHCDVNNTYSWSVSLCGVKHWQMWPPQDTHMLYDIFGRKLAPWPRDPNTAPLMWPLACKAACIEFTQQPFEAVFVPSGWCHSVVNASKGGVLSLNANWFNAFNLHWVCHHVMLDEGSEARNHLVSMLHCVIEQTRAGIHSDSALLEAFTIARCKQALLLLQTKQTQRY